MFANAITRVPHVVAGNVTTLLSPSLINRVLGQVLATWLPTTWPRPDIRGTRRKVAAAVPAAAPGVEEGDARRLTGLFSHALPGTLAVLSSPARSDKAGIVTLAGAVLAG